MISELTVLQLAICEALISYGTLDADEIRTRVCVASLRRFEEAMDGLKRGGFVIYRGSASDGCWKCIKKPRNTTGG